MNTLIEIAKALSVEMGIAQPESVQGTDPDAVRMVRFINETGSELARRVDWSALNKRHDFAGTGADTAYTLPTDHMRFARGMAVSRGGLPVRGGLSTDEWFSLTPSEGDPRYFRASSTQIWFYPYPPLSMLVTVSYQSKNWCEDTGGTGKDAMSTDTDKTRVPAALLLRGAMWRWMRHTGRDFSDHMAEFEAMLADLAAAEGGVRQP